MKIPRMLLQPADFSDETVTFPRRQTHYLRSVLRLEPGDMVEVFDGTLVHLVRLTTTGVGPVRGEVLSSRRPDTPDELEITLAFGCVRPGPFQEILRHGTELGVRCFVPVISRRTVRRPEGKKDRWEHVIASALSQSGRTALPRLEAPAELKDVISSRSDSQSGLVLSLHPSARSILGVLEEERPRAVLLLVGPEGGFDPAEEENAVERGFTRVSLGMGILRTETAALAAAGICVAWFQTVRTQSAGFPWAQGDESSSTGEPR